ncbi:MAG: V-type ATP synthase subunit F [Candidatus Diapherotrites archaeon]|nr:V-type ATP synthase subunit F [Candidatus Diapherotrites archaeon]
MAQLQDFGHNFKVAVLGDEKTVIGFKLAGLKKTFVADENEIGLLKQFHSIVSEQDTGLVIIDSSCNKILKEILLFIEQNRKPVIIQIPSWKHEQGSQIFDLVVRWASGIKKR